MEEAGSDYRPIEDYAIIGDCASAALISRVGSIDWLCWPQFDSPSIFGALLDRHRGGRFRIAPTCRFDVHRRYVENTNVLETTFETNGGVIRLTDLMPVAEFAAYERDFWPDHSLIRKVECLSGEVDVEVLYEPRLDYARITPRIQDRGNLGYFCQQGAYVLILRSDIPLERSADHATLRATETLRAGDRRLLALNLDEFEPAVLPLLGDAAEELIENTLDYWRKWVAQCDYDGPYRDELVRSALTLKLMTYSRSGAIVAAPTTSLPEWIGGVRNWDYRYCWLRDAGMCVRVLMELGYRREADAFFHWLLHTTWPSLPSPHIMYDVFGRANLNEHTLDHLEGYRESRPVRVGNAAVHQLQLDTYGELALAAYEFVKHGGHLDRWQKTMLVKTGEALLKRWREPDEGIWEIRSEPRHHTYSKVMSWVAMNRLVKLHDGGHLTLPRERFMWEAQEIRETVEREGYNAELGAFVSEFGGDRMDASLLLMCEYEFMPAEDSRMMRTFDLIHERLSRGVLLHRYEPDEDDGLPPGEGAFGLCSFWDDAYLARLGHLDEAVYQFETMLGYANDVGLFAEQIHEKTGEHLGNFPQAFTHIGLINTLLMIAHKSGQRYSPELEDGIPQEESDKGDAA